MTRIWFDYLEVGDQIRYHGKNMSFYEKYDKTKDEFIPCAGCGYDEDSRASYCGKCGCVLLKGTMQNL